MNPSVVNGSWPIALTFPSFNAIMTRHRNKERALNHALCLGIRVKILGRCFSLRRCHCKCSAAISPRFKTAAFIIQSTQKIFPGGANEKPDVALVFDWPFGSRCGGAYVFIRHSSADRDVLTGKTWDATTASRPLPGWRRHLGRRGYVGDNRPVRGRFHEAGLRPRRQHPFHYGPAHYQYFGRGRAGLVHVPVGSVRAAPKPFTP